MPLKPFIPPPVISLLAFARSLLERELVVAITLVAGQYLIKTTFQCLTEQGKWPKS